MGQDPTLKRAKEYAPETGTTIGGQVRCQRIDELVVVNRAFIVVLWPL